jgi:sigma-B regulation protein RsbU (phosphoserine phosphatase)
MNSKERIAELEERLRQAEERLKGCSEEENFLLQAAEIQRGILPGAAPHMEGYDLAALMRPARAVGGDFYDYIPLLLGQETMGILVGDVTDKGVPASLYMALTHGMMHAGLSLTKGISPEKMLIWLNLQLGEVSKSGMFVTLTFGILNSKDHTFHYARAGHTRPYMFDESGRTVYRGSPRTGQPLGILNHPSIDSDTIDIPVQGIIALYSDGLADETNPEECAFGMERLEELIAENRNLSALGICEKVMAELEAYRQGSRQYDDCTIMIIKRER